MKTCTKCGETKDVVGFYAATSNRDGLKNQCKVCCLASAAKRYASNPEPAKIRAAKWDKEHPEQVKLRQTKHRTNNRVELNSNALAKYHADPTKRTLSATKWRLANIERVRANCRRWSLSNAEHHNRLRAEWRENNPDAGRIMVQNRRAKLRNSNGKLSAGLAKRLFALQKGLCPCCGKHLGIDYHLDHIMPVALGGEHVDSNIQLLRASCNFSKSARHPVDYMQSRGFLL